MKQALLTRIEKRVAETIAAGGTVRADDNPESFQDTARCLSRADRPGVGIITRAAASLKIVDGMAPIDEVTREIARRRSIGRKVACRG